MTAIDTVEIKFRCPNCGADGYEVDLSADDVAGGVQTSFKCDECPVTICVDADVRIEVRR